MSQVLGLSKNLKIFQKSKNLPKFRKSSKILKIFQKSENLPKFWKSSKNLKILQKSENLPKIWKSSKNLKIFQKSENLSKIWKSSKNLSDQMSQWSQVSRIALCMAKVKVTQSVSQSVTRSPIELFWTAKNHPVSFIWGKKKACWQELCQQ